MADLTTSSTFIRTIEGNRVVVDCDISSSGTGTTSDTVSIPYLTAIIGIGTPQYRTSVWDPIATTALVGPFLTVGSSANTLLIARSSLASTVAFRVRVTGR